MSHALMQLLARPWTHRLPPRWYEPDLIIIDDLAGPNVLRDLVDAFGAHVKTRHPHRIRIVSSVDPVTATPERLAADEILREFASDQNIEMTHTSSACDSLTVPDLRLASDVGLAVTVGSPLPNIGASGGVCLRINSIDAAGALATGRIWHDRPAVHEICVRGQLPPTTTLHDLALELTNHVPLGDWLALHGDAIADPIKASWLLTLCRQNGIAVAFKPDEDWPLTTEASSRNIDLNALSPMVCSGRELAKPVSAASDLRVDRVFIGSCSSGSVRDLELAARIMAGGRVAVPTSIAPSSADDFELLTMTPCGDHGTLAQVFEKSGCDIALPGCAGCVNALADLNAAPTTKSPEVMNCVSTGTANIQTQQVAQVFTVSPMTAARAALTGRLGG